MFGRQDPFTYLECQQCGVLVLQDIPTNLDEYYPINYYSFSAVPTYADPPRGLRRQLFLCRNYAHIFNRPAWLTLLAKLRPRRDLPLKELSDLFCGVPSIGFDARVLDIGCGQGAILRGMLAAGFTDLTGVDPFTSQDVTISDSLRIYRAQATVLAGRKFDFILLNHSLEHMPDQFQAMSTIRELLDSRGSCLIRIPISRSEPYETYKDNWVELDPPRHIVIHSIHSLKSLAAQCGLEVVNVRCDSDILSYYGSELYRRGISLADPHSGRWRNPAKYFTAAEIKDFEARAAAANRNMRGGRAAFVLKHARDSRVNSAGGAPSNHNVSIASPFQAQC